MNLLFQVLTLDKLSKFQLKLIKFNFSWKNLCEISDLSNPTEIQREITQLSKKGNNSWNVNINILYKWL
jgi:hypothetical protein